MKIAFNNVLLIDGSNLLHRAYHSHLHMANKKGVPTGAIYGSLRILKSYIEKFEPLQVVVALDTVRTSFRNELFPEYKAKRLERDDALQQQFLLMKDFCERANIPCLDEDYYEADDLLGSIANEAVGSGYTPYVVSGDKDMFQLISNDINVVYINTKDNSLVFYDEVVFADRYNGLKPIQLLDVKGLQGDTSDNIPGVKGVGETTALKLIAEYGTLDNLYGNLGDLKGKMKEKIENERDMAYLSKKLATIVTDIPIPFPDQKIYNFNSPRVQEFLQELEIRTL